MKYKIIWILSLVTLFAITAYSQDKSIAAQRGAVDLKEYFHLSESQKDSLTASLPAYYKAKKTFMQNPRSDADDAKKLQDLYDGILEKIFTDKQYSLYKKIKLQHLKLMNKRTTNKKTTK